MKAHLLMIAVLIMACEKENQALDKNQFEFKLDGVQFGWSWQNVTTGGDEIVAEASNSELIIGVTFNRSHTYSNTKAEITLNNGMKYRPVPGKFTIKSKTEGNAISGEFYGKLANEIDTFEITEGEFYHE